MKIGMKGKIIEGDYKGWYVLVQDDNDNTGGYLILLSDNINFKGGQGYDDWVDSEQSLKRYFEESKWIIEWNERT